MFAYSRRQNEPFKAMPSTRWSVFKGKRRDARKKKDIWPYPLRKRRRKKVRLTIASLFLPHFLTFVFLSAIPTNGNCFALSAVSCAAGMQASQATILAVRIQPFVHMTQFQHRSINRAGICHQTTGSPVQVSHFRPAYSSICRQESVSHFSFHSVASFVSAGDDGLTFPLIWEWSSDRHYQSGRPKKAPLKHYIGTSPSQLPRPAFNWYWWCKRIFLDVSSSVPELKIEGNQGAKPHCVLNWMHLSADGFAASAHI